MKKVLIAVGGSGGHVLPAEVLADELIQKNPELDCLFVGSNLKTNPFFNKTKYKYKEISSSSLSSKNPFKVFKSLKILMKGVIESRKILKDFKPDVVVGFGSYHSFPLLAASSIENKPLVLHAADSIPGRTLRLLSLFATVSTVFFEEAKKKLKGHTVSVKHPIKADYYGNISKEEAYQYFNLEPSIFIFLVFGGSQGAQFINQIFKSLACDLKKEISAFQVIHFTGDLKSSLEMEILYKQLGIKAFVKPYDENIHKAWSIANFAITRSGAGTIAEHIESEVPCLFIPYPFAKDKHQDVNADFMVYQVGGAIKVSEAKASKELLKEKIKGLLSQDCKELKKMKHALSVYKSNRPDCTLADIVMSVRIKNG
jgi:UDP-N-acetylglucosamine--N-acetylmuramyl-(pentapeptide) pyrophosphoryl-undecaprenol N-acetylglucosamine transferase